MARKHTELAKSVLVRYYQIVSKLIPDGVTPTTLQSVPTNPTATDSKYIKVGNDYYRLEAKRGTEFNATTNAGGLMMGEPGVNILNGNDSILVGTYNADGTYAGVVVYKPITEVITLNTNNQEVPTAQATESFVVPQYRAVMSGTSLSPEENYVYEFSQNISGNITISSSNLIEDVTNTVTTRPTYIYFKTSSDVNGSISFTNTPTGFTTFGNDTLKPGRSYCIIMKDGKAFVTNNEDYDIAVKKLTSGEGILFRNSDDSATISEITDEGIIKLKPAEVATLGGIKVVNRRDSNVDKISGIPAIADETNRTVQKNTYGIEVGPDNKGFVTIKDEAVGGNFTPIDKPAEVTITSGSTAYANGWFTDDQGEVITETGGDGTVYHVSTSGEYQNKYYVWNGTAYTEVSDPRFNEIYYEYSRGQGTTGVKANNRNGIELGTVPVVNGQRYLIVLKERLQGSDRLTIFMNRDGSDNQEISVLYDNTHQHWVQNSVVEVPTNIVLEFVGVLASTILCLRYNGIYHVYEDLSSTSHSQYRNYVVRGSGYNASTETPNKFLREDGSWQEVAGAIESITFGTGLNGGTVDSTNPIGNVSLKPAATDTIGGIKISAKRAASPAVTITSGGTTGANYGIETTSTDQAFVNIPWDSVIISDTAGNIKVNGSNVAISGWSDKADLNSPTFTGTPTAPTATAGTSTTQLATTEFVMNAFKANDSMIFKGTIGAQADNPTVTSLPSIFDAGWTYKVVTDGTYAGQICEKGDMIVAVVDRTSGTPQDSDWAVIQGNIDGTVTSSSPSSVNNHVAVYDGTSGKIIKDSGYTIQTSVPANAVFTDTWDANALNKAGYVAAPSSNDGNKAWMTDGTGAPSWTTIGAGVINNDRFVRYDTNSQGLNGTQMANARANIGAGTGTVTEVTTGIGLQGGPITNIGQISLKTSTTSEIGGVKIAGERNSAITTTQGGTTANRYYGVEKDSNDKLFVNIPWTDTTYTLPLAENGTRGGIQIGFTTDTTNHNYAVQLSSEKAYVNVPWTDEHTTKTGHYDATSEEYTPTAGSWTWNSTNVITGITKDSKGHITGVTTTTIANPNTDNDTKVDQKLSSQNANRPILLADTTASVDTDTINSYAYRNNSIYANPYTGNIQATKFNGYVLADASEKSVDTSISYGSTSANLPTSQAVAAFVTPIYNVNNTTATPSITVAENTIYRCTNAGVTSLTLDVTDMMSTSSVKTRESIIYFHTGSNPTLTINGKANDTMVFGDETLEADKDYRISVKDRTITISTDISTVTSITAGTGLNGGTIIESGTISLKTASNNEIGGIKIGYAQSGKNYPIVLDENDKAYVNVPWEDHTYTVGEGILTIQKNGSAIDTFSANATENKTINITVPTKDSDITNDRYVRFDASQSLTAAQQQQARTNIGAGVGTVTSVSTGKGLAGGAITNVGEIYLKDATVSEIGGVKVAATRNSAVSTIEGGTTANRYYGVESDSNGKVFVNVPWTDRYAGGITSGDVTNALGYIPYNSTNPSGYITGITSSDVTNALGYTPYNSTNPNGYITGITSSDVTTALGYTPYNSTNPNGYISGISSSDVTTALGYTPYNSTNPDGYTTNTGTVTSVDGNGANHISVTGGAITTSGTLTIGVESGYEIPSTTRTSQWDTAVLYQSQSLTAAQQQQARTNIGAGVGTVTSISTGKGLAGGAITNVGEIYLKDATASEIGGVKVAATRNSAITTVQGGNTGTYHGLETDSNGKGFININWANYITNGASNGTINVNGSAVSVGGWSSKADLESPTFTGTPAAPTAAAGTNTTQIATTAFVNSAIDDKIAAADAMVFKGTVNSNSELPSTPNCGWTYVVGTAGTYAGQTCEAGDMIIAKRDCTSDSPATNADWAVVQVNLNGAVIGPSSSVDGNVVLFDGTTGKLIKDSGKTLGVSVPANAIFTDENVAQEGTSSDSELPILIKNATVGDSTSHVKYVNASNKGVTINASTGTITAPKYVVRGSDGNPITTNNIMLGNGNTITAPYQANNYLTFNGSSFVWSPVTNGTVTSVSTGKGLAGGAITNVGEIYLKDATASEIGGIKVSNIRNSAVTTTQGSTTANRYYGVETDSNGKAFVNVPWTDRYSGGITSSDVTNALGYTPYNSTNPSGYITGITSSDVTAALGYTPYDSTNPNGYITGITSSDVTTALGYTPYNSTNPNGYISGISSSDVTTALGYTPYNSTNPNGYITGITSSDVTTALGYTPYNSTNPNGYITGITSSDVTTALGYTPYNSTNPNGYTTNTGTVTSVNGSGSGHISVTGGPIETNGTLTVGVESGYEIPSTTRTGQWDTAYGWGDHASAGYAKSVTVNGNTYSASSNIITLPNYPSSDSDLTNNRYVRFDAAQSLNGTQQAQARANIGAGTGTVTSISTGIGLAGGAITNVGEIYLKNATVSEIGGIKVAGIRNSVITTQQGGANGYKNYGVETDINGKAFVNVPWADGTVTSISTGTGLQGGPITNVGQISLKSATPSEIGGVKVAATRNSAVSTTEGGTTTNRYYGIETDSNNKMFVNVPWTDHYSGGITSSDVTNALGYTPYNSTNPNGYITGISSSDVTTALGYTPYNSTNPNGYITGITSSDVTTALGYTPYNSTNPNGYTSNTGTVTSVNGTGASGSHISVTGGSITTSGTLTVGVDSGYSIPSDSNQSNWNTAYNWGDHSSAGYATSVTVNGNSYSTSSGVITLPDYPAVYNATLTIQKNSSTVASFSANSNSNVTANISVPTSDSDLTNNRYVRFDTSSQGLSAAQQVNARANIGAGTGTVTSISTGTGLTGGAITNTGTIELKSATVSEIGGVKASAIRNSAVTAITGGTTADRYYGVELDSNNRMFVNVPWVSGSSSGGTVTSVATGIGLTGGTITTSGTLKAKLRDETLNSSASSKSTSSDGGLYSVEADKDGYLAVRVPWTDHTYNVYNASLTVTVNGTTIGNNFTANSSSNRTYAITGIKESEFWKGSATTSSGVITFSFNSSIYRTHYYEGRIVDTDGSGNIYVRLNVSDIKAPENYFLLHNETQSNVTIIWESMAINGNDVDNAIVPSDSITIPAGKFIEGSYWADVTTSSFGALIDTVGVVTVSGELTLAEIKK